jgi:hypothetical protein
MKKCLVILLSLQLLFGNTLLPELVKLPRLFEHYFEHKTCDTHLSFYNFIKMHYADPDHQESDEDNHKKLPLKSASYAHAEELVLQNDTPSVEWAFPAITIVKKVLNPATTNYFDHLFHLTIFQPPRVQ